MYYVAHYSIHIIFYLGIFFDNKTGTTLDNYWKLNPNPKKCHTLRCESQLFKMNVAAERFITDLFF